MVEYDDLSVDIKRKEELVAEAEQLENAEDLSDSIRKATSLQKQWRKLQDWESVYEEELREKFDKALDAVFAKRGSIYKSAEEAKNNLVAKAKEVAASTNFNEATKQMNDLMNQWKATASAGKDTDDALWAQFNEARQAFFDSKKNYFDELNAKFANAKTVKEELVEKAAALSNSTEWKKTTEEFNKLLEQWKSVGSAGKDAEQALWDKFKEARQVFFDNRKVHYEEVQKQYDEKYEAKKSLVEEVKTLIAENNFTKETTEKVKGLRTEWKKIGSAGKDREDSIWQEFNGAIDSYFTGLKEFNEKKHTDWVNRQKDSIDYKKSLIERTKRQISRIKDDIANTLKESAIVELHEEIKDKDAYIAELEKQIAEIEAKINK